MSGGSAPWYGCAMFNKRCLLAFLMLVSVATPRARAAESDPADAVLSHLGPYASGFMAAPADCEDILRETGHRAGEASFVPPGAFARATPARKVKTLHTLVDFWYRAAVRTQDSSLFENHFAQEQLANFVRHARLLNGVPLMQLRPLTHELLVLGAKLESISSPALRLPPEYVTILRNLLARIARLRADDTPEAHGLRAIVLGQLSYLGIVESGGAAVTASPSRESDPDLKLALERARQDLVEAFAEDEAGPGWLRYVNYSAILLHHLIVDHAVTAPEDQPFARREIVKVVDILSHGVAKMIEVNGLWERRQLDHIFGLLNVIVHPNRVVSERVPGLRDRLDRLIDVIVESRTGF